VLLDNGQILRLVEKSGLSNSSLPISVPT